jgi:hypothetical protein
MTQIRIPKLPQLIDRKIYKTGQTRGADDDVIFQNRVGRNSTVLIPFNYWLRCSSFPAGEDKFENGYIVLISPTDYFSTDSIEQVLKDKGLVLGKNCLVFYETREQWNKYNPDTLKWKAAQNRIAPLGGNFVARVPATTATDGGSKIIRGFTETSGKGAGIRIYEYASSQTIKKCRDQLEVLFWLCNDSDLVLEKAGMSKADILIRKKIIFESCDKQELLDYQKLIGNRIINKNHRTVCPLCLEELSSNGFFTRMQQAEGHEVPDLTVTELNLFHISELRIGIYNHKTYNLGWGHHHCNVVTKDSGIDQTLQWIKSVIDRNVASGYIIR